MRIRIPSILSLWACMLFLFQPVVSSGQGTGDEYPEIVFSSDSMPPYRTIINAWDDKLEYSQDELGNRVPDFSYCGYLASEKPIPDVDVKILMPPVNGDATPYIQAAIDYVSSLEPDGEGVRGAVLLAKGTYELSGSLFIRTSGVVLRGRGCGAGGTVLVGDGVIRETLIQVEGGDAPETGEKIALKERYFPLNATTLEFEGAHPFQPGDQVVVNRPSTPEWLEMLGTDRLGVDDFRTRWDPGDFDLNWIRTVVSTTEHTIVLDAPLTNALEPAYGGGSVAKVAGEGMLRNVGIENLRCVSAYDQDLPKDENHRWMAVTLNHVTDGWVRRVTAEHFVSSAVAVWEGCRRITVEDCKSLSPVGEAGNYRRYAFQTLGQQVLFQRCYAEYAYHAFSVGFTTPGPNAFVQCYSYLPIHFSGAVGGWSTGILFDKVTTDGGEISFGWRDMDGQGGGWSAANSLCWQCRAAKIHLPHPPTAQNWAYGNWAQPQGNGMHTWPHTFLKPESLFYDQLEERLGVNTGEKEKMLVYQSDETTAPQPDMALAMSRRSKQPDLVMDVWIDSMIRTYPLSLDTSAAIPFDPSMINQSHEPASTLQPVYLEGGRLVREGKLVVGRRMFTALWRGNTRPSGLSQAGPHLTRYVPGRTGRGLTDDLPEVALELSENRVAALDHFPSLWYERRRDDHARFRRSDADVWTPFYEQPFSRSGQGEAYDRLSRYDLDRWNPWYWSRLREFASLADAHGLLLIQEHYLQHNIIEEGAHWVDYPWRSANNINDLGFAEPPHYSGDKRVFMAGEFYDTTNVRLKEYHRRYIRKSLDNVQLQHNVIHDIGQEYTGPLHFIQFWLDVLAEWQREHQKDVLVMLQGTKEVQDAILSDPERAELVDVIDIRQWHYREDGSLYAPAGGVSLAQRQYARIFDPGRTSFDQIYRAVHEYRTRYPDKGVVSSLRGSGPYTPWAVFMAGGSLAPIPTVEEDGFLEMAAKSKAYTDDGGPAKHYILEQEGGGYIIFSEGPEIYLRVCERDQEYTLRWINPLDGRVIDHPETIIPRGTGTVRAPSGEVALAWLTLKQ